MPVLLVLVQLYRQWARRYLELHPIQVANTHNTPTRHKARISCDTLTYTTTDEGLDSSDHPNVCLPREALSPSAVAKIGRCSVRPRKPLPLFDVFDEEGYLAWFIPQGTECTPHNTAYHAYLTAANQLLHGDKPDAGFYTRRHNPS